MKNRDNYIKLGDINPNEINKMIKFNLFEFSYNYKKESVIDGFNQLILFLKSNNALDNYYILTETGFIKITEVIKYNFKLFSRMHCLPYIDSKELVETFNKSTLLSDCYLNFKDEPDNWYRIKHEFTYDSHFKRTHKLYMFDEMYYVKNCVKSCYYNRYNEYLQIILTQKDADLKDGISSHLIN